MEDFRKFELEITKDKLKLLEIADLYKDLLAENKQGDAFYVLEKSKYQELAKEFRQKIVDFREKVNTTLTTVDNADFLRNAKQFLSQFEDNTQEFNQLIFDEIEKLAEARQTALSNKDFKLAGQLVDKSVALKQKLELK